MLFESDIQNLQSEIADLEEIVANRRAQIEQLNQVSSAADDAVAALKEAVAKVSGLAPDAIGLLKSTVLGLFDNGSGGGNDDPQPEPAPNDDSGEDIPESFDDFGGDDDSDNSIQPGSLIEVENPSTGEVFSWVTPTAEPIDPDQPQAAYIRKVRSRFQKTLGYEHISESGLTVNFVRSTLRNNTNSSMTAINFDRLGSGKAFWLQVDRWLQQFEEQRAAEPEFSFTESPGSDALTPTYLVFRKGEVVGTVRESLTLKGWLHKHSNIKQPFPTKEDCAADLYARKQREAQTLERSHDEILSARGF